jgi:hypothetical protein
LIPILACLKRENLDPFLVDFLFFGDQKCDFRNEPLNIQKNVFNKVILDFLLDLNLFERGHRVKIDFPYCAFYNDCHKENLVSGKCRTKFSRGFSLLAAIIEEYVAAQEMCKKILENPGDNCI